MPDTTTGPSAGETVLSRSTSRTGLNETSLRAMRATEDEIESILSRRLPSLPTTSEWKTAILATECAKNFINNHPECSLGEISTSYLHELSMHNWVEYLLVPEENHADLSEDNKTYLRLRLALDLTRGLTDHVPHSPEWDKIASADAPDDLKASFEADQLTLRTRSGEHEAYKDIWSQSVPPFSL
jgi:hypothetical protein